MARAPDNHVRNRSGVIIPIEDRASAKLEVLQAIRERYPADATVVWNLTVMDHILDNPAKFPVMHRLLTECHGKNQKRIITNGLTMAGCTAERQKDKGNGRPWFNLPRAVAAL